MGKGLFISIEGPDGSGKSTQIENIKRFFAEKNMEIVFTREPGGTPIAEQIRGIILDGKNVEMADAPIIPKTALSPEAYVESYHVIPKIRIKDCENVNMSDGSMVPNIIKLEDSYSKGSKGDFIFRD